MLNSIWSLSHQIFMIMMPSVLYLFLLLPISFCDGKHKRTTMLVRVIFLTFFPKRFWFFLYDIFGLGLFGDLQPNHVSYKNILTYLGYIILAIFLSLFLLVSRVLCAWLLQLFILVLFIFRLYVTRR